MRMNIGMGMEVDIEEEEDKKDHVIWFNREGEAFYFTSITELFTSSNDVYEALRFTEVEAEEAWDYINKRSPWKPIIEKRKW
jgi:hypothetical protein